MYGNLSLFFWWQIVAAPWRCGGHKRTCHQVNTQHSVSKNMPSPAYHWCSHSAVMPVMMPPPPSFLLSLLLSLSLSPFINRLHMSNTFYESAGQNWFTLDSVHIHYNWTHEAVFNATEVYAPATYSYHCQHVSSLQKYDTLLVPSSYTDSSANWHITFTDFQVGDRKQAGHYQEPDELYIFYILGFNWIYKVCSPIAVNIYIHLNYKNLQSLLIYIFLLHYVSVYSVLCVNALWFFSVLSILQAYSNTKRHNIKLGLTWFDFRSCLSFWRLFYK